MLDKFFPENGNCREDVPIGCEAVSFPFDRFRNDDALDINRVGKLVSDEVALLHSHERMNFIF